MSKGIPGVPAVPGAPTEPPGRPQGPRAVAFDIGEWIRRQELVVHPRGFGFVPEVIPVGQVLHRTHETIEADIDLASAWFWRASTLLTAVSAVLGQLERDKATLAATLTGEAHSALLEENVKPTEKLIDAKIRVHPDYLQNCAAIIAAGSEKDNLERLLYAIDRRVEALRTISANHRAALEKANARPAHFGGQQ